MQNKLDIFFGPQSSETTIENSPQKNEIKNI
jgi:hypothetical protein